ncbi:MAG: hypothetical protein IKE23_01515, partial [Exiguobacterium sp.]|nr:hypothetical protein [Exiguobacterium sp.]
EDPESVKAHEEAQEVVERVYSEIASIVEAQKANKKQGEKMKIYVKSTFENDYEAFASLDEALQSYKEFRAETDDTVEDDEEIYLASGVAHGNRYFAIHNNPEYGVSCTPASLAKFDEWWDENWDSEVC